MPDTAVADTGITSDVSSSVFTVSSGGVYRIAYQFKLSAPTGLDARVIVNGAFQKPSLTFNSIAQVDLFGASSLLALNAGDTVEVQLFGDSIPVLLESGSGAWLTIEKIN